MCNCSSRLNASTYKENEEHNNLFSREICADLKLNQKTSIPSPENAIKRSQRGNKTVSKFPLLLMRGNWIFIGFDDSHYYPNLHTNT